MHVYSEDALRNPTGVLKICIEWDKDTTQYVGILSAPAGGWTEESLTVAVNEEVESITNIIDQPLAFYLDDEWIGSTEA